MQCRICKSKELKKIFSLGMQPLANEFVEKATVKSTLYPLEWLECQHCGLIQLSNVIPKERMYVDYSYVPSVSKTYLDHFNKLSEHLIKDLKLKEGDLVVDIGGSDGSFSKIFKSKGMKVLNIDPAQNIKNEVDKLTGFFDKTYAAAAVDLKGKAKLVTATNVFAHIDNLQEFLEGLDILLAEDGVFFAQFPDVRNLLAENQFDTIYHEHLSYFTTEPLYHLFSKSKFELYKIEHSDIHGGSMRIYVRRRSDLVKSFVKNVKQIKKDLNKYLSQEHRKGKRIVGFGAAAKGMILINYCGIGKYINYIVDGTPYKQGKYTPGTHIPIYPEEELLKNPPDIVLILAWNFKDEIMYKLEGRGYTFVIPIPEVKIIK